LREEEEEPTVGTQPIPALQLSAAILTQRAEPLSSISKVAPEEEALEEAAEEAEAGEVRVGEVTPHLTLLQLQG
jgi:hypothetical protein